MSKYFENYQFEGEHLIFGTGGSASVHYNKSRFAVSTDCLVAKPKEQDELFNSKYVFYYLYSNMHILDSGFRGAGLMHIPKAYIDNIIIPLPSFGDQNKIVEVIDRITNVLRNQQLILNYLNQLKFSIFQSLFGNLSENVNKWKEEPLRNLIIKDDKINYGVVQPGNDFPNGVPVIRVGDIFEMGINQSNLKLIDPKLEAKNSKTRLFGDEILIVCVGSTIGKIGIVDQSLKNFNIVRATARVRCSANKINRIYLAYFLETPHIQAHLKNLTKSVGQPTININSIEKLPIILPPRAIQNKFEKLWSQIETIKSKRKFIVLQQQTLLQSIMQEAFLGRLKTNIKAFSLDDQVVEYIENEDLKKDNLNEEEQLFNDIKNRIINHFGNQPFTFLEMQNVINDEGINLEYEYNIDERKQGLKDFIYNSVIPNSERDPFLKQIFKIDENRDIEKGIDNSRVVFAINNQ